jgi:hypothetical protein
MFYPIPSARAMEFLTPGAAVDQDITDRTVAVHLWNNRLAAFKNTPPPAGSFIGEHFRRLEQTRTAESVS